MNDLMADAGDLFAALAHAAMPAFPSLGLPRNSIVQAQHRPEPPSTIDVAKKYQLAKAVLRADPQLREVADVVDRIVLSDHKLADVGRDVSGYASGKQGEAAALVLLRIGLKKLAVHFGLIDPSGRRASPQARPDRPHCWRGASDQPPAPASA